MIHISLKTVSTPAIIVIHFFVYLILVRGCTVTKGHAPIPKHSYPFIHRHPYPVHLDTQAHVHPDTYAGLHLDIIPQIPVHPDDYTTIPLYIQTSKPLHTETRTIIPLYLFLLDHMESHKAVNCARCPGYNNLQLCSEIGLKFMHCIGDPCITW